MPLNILPVNRVLAGGMPLGNIMDFAPLLNVMPFVTCKAPTHPLVILTGVAPCIPVTSPWIPTTPNVLVGIAPVLNMGDQTICCMWGGMISINMSGQFTVM
jgi:hypothetical protein